MPEPTVPPDWTLSREEVTREDGRYLIYYTFTETDEEPEAGDTPACPS